MNGLFSGIHMLFSWKEQNMLEDYLLIPIFVSLILLNNNAQ